MDNEAPVFPGLADGVDRARLVRLRAQKVGGPAEMARRLGLSRSRYHHYESGRRRFPVAVLLKVAQILGCPAEHLAPPRTRPKNNLPSL